MEVLFIGLESQYDSFDNENINSWYENSDDEENPDEEEKSETNVEVDPEGELICSLNTMV